MLTIHSVFRSANRAILKSFGLDYNEKAKTQDLALLSYEAFSLAELGLDVEAKMVETKIKVRDKEYTVQTPSYDHIEDDYGLFVKWVWSQALNAYHLKATNEASKLTGVKPGSLVDVQLGYTTPAEFLEGAASGQWQRDKASFINLLYGPWIMRSYGQEPYASLVKALREEGGYASLDADYRTAILECLTEMHDMVVEVTSKQERTENEQNFLDLFDQYRRVHETLKRKLESAKPSKLKRLA